MSGMEEWKQVKNEALRLNRDSLIHMATRQVKSIFSSGNKSSLLKKMSDYLLRVISVLENDHTHDDLKQLEEHLELTQCALIHLWISPPYNGILFVPRALSHVQIDALQALLESKRKNHLKIAYSKAA